MLTSNDTESRSAYCIGMLINLLKIFLDMDVRKPGNKLPDFSVRKSILVTPDDKIPLAMDVDDSFMEISGEIDVWDGLDDVFRDRDELLEWARSVGYSYGFVIDPAADSNVEDMPRHSFV
ncbi:hypothetical protein VNO80_25977 [Phaseolus coccineus]|uniref:Uncharacterized protein n=1 Tax=Phaseolus coccineus TaxID=3886 RepID=A0AAN9LW84_PHACN